MKDIEKHVKHIVEMLEKGFDDDELNTDGEPMSAFDYINDSLDIEYIISSKGAYLGARILVAFGGPNIWINTRTNQVEGYWWGDTCILSFTDGMGLDDAANEIYQCVKA